MSQVSLNVSHTAPSQTILPILVLYNCTLANSATYRTFLAAANNAALDPALIAVYDNSQFRQVSLAEETHLFAYKHDPSNGGIAAAYNWALDIANSQSFSWLLLLDQDTSLPVTFLAFLSDAVRLYNTNESIAAIVPRATDRDVA